jgi:HEAT repeat protein
MDGMRTQSSASLTRLASAAVLLLGTIVGCGTSKPSPEQAQAPEVARPKVTRPYDVRGERNPGAAEPPPFPVQLATVTERIAENTTPPRSAEPPIKPFQDWDMPETAARALGRIGEAAVPQLTQALSDPNPLVRKRAADVLARIGPDAKDAVPALIRSLGDRDEEVRKAATRALGEIGPGAAEAVPRLIEALREPARLDSPDNG